MTTQITDLSMCAPIDGDWQSLFSVSNDDGDFAVGLASGAQDTGYRAYFYSRGRGCRVWNTESGEITGNWGPTGRINIPDRFYVHEVTMSRYGDYVIVGRYQNNNPYYGQPYFWQVDSLNVTYCNSDPGSGMDCGGHPAAGYHLWMNPTGPFGGSGLRPYSNLNDWQTVVSNVPPGIVPPLDTHASWHNDNPADDNPFLVVTTNNLTFFTYAWDNEVLYEDPVTGSVGREAHTFSTGDSPYFATSQAIGNISQDGRFVLFTSDWMDSLGTDYEGNPRSDVFALKLQQF